MKKFLLSFRSFSTRLVRLWASSAPLQRGLVIGLPVFVAGTVLVLIALRAKLAGQSAAGPEPASEDFQRGPNPPIYWDPMLNPVEYAAAEAPFKTAEELQTEEFAGFTISDPQGFSEQMRKFKTKEHIDQEESAMSAIKNPEVYKKQVDAQKTEDQLEIDQASVASIKQPDFYNKIRSRRKDPEEKRLEALAIKDILNPHEHRSSDGVSETNPKPSRN